MNKQEYIPFAGIGSRETPPDILKEMAELSEYLLSVGLTLRTGGARGADNAFAMVVNATDSNTELYLPWYGYEGWRIPTLPLTPLHYETAAKAHPAWHNCSTGARKMHARNSQIILGAELNSFVDFVICWTPNGKLTGGTAVGIRIANTYNIPVWNLAVHSPEEVLEWFHKEYSVTEN